MASQAKQLIPTHNVVNELHRVKIDELINKNLKLEEENKKILEMNQSLLKGEKKFLIEQRSLKAEKEALQKGIEALEKTRSSWKKIANDKEAEIEYLKKKVEEKNRERKKSEPLKEWTTGKRQQETVSKEDDSVKKDAGELIREAYRYTRGRGKMRRRGIRPSS